MVPLSALVTTRRISGPEYTNRFNLYRAAQVIGGAAPGYSSGQAMAALEEVAKEVLPPRDRLRLGRPLVSGEAGFGRSDDGVRPVAGLCVSDPGGALRELVAAVLGAADRSDRRLRRLSSASCCAASIWTSTRRSV